MLIAAKDYYTHEGDWFLMLLMVGVGLWLLRELLIAKPDDGEVRTHDGFLEEAPEKPYFYDREKEGWG